MQVKREDLMAAASEGLLQYRQVDQMLVLIRVRAVQAERAGAPVARQAGATLPSALVYLLAILVIGVTALVAGMYSELSFSRIGIEGLLWFIGVYGVLTLALAVWTERRRIGGAIRLLITSVVALLPLAVFAAQHFSSL